MEPRFSGRDIRKEYGGSGKVAIASGGTRRKVAANFNQPTNKSSEIVCDGARKVAGASGGARGKVAADNSNQPSIRSVEM